MNNYVVYKHTSPCGKVYIGITCRNPVHRWNHGKGYSRNQYFTNAIEKYGWDSFKHEILFSGLTKKEACEKEKLLIGEYKSNDRLYGYNLSSGGENPAEGVKQNDETKEKRAQSLRGRKYPLRGKNISIAKKGKPNGREGKLGKDGGYAFTVCQIDEATGAIINTFCGFNEAHRETGFAKTPIRECALGIRKRAYGYLWTCEKRG